MGVLIDEIESIVERCLAIIIVIVQATNVELNDANNLIYITFFL